MELIRVFSKKRLLVLLVLLVINGIFFYKESTDLKTYRIYNDLILEFNNQNQDAAVTKTAANLAVKEYVSKNKGINKEDEFKAAKEMFLEKVEYIRTYSDKKDEQIKKSKAMLSSSIFSDKDSFSYLNIIKTREDLIKIKDEKVTVSNGVWLEKIANYKFVYYVIIIALSVIIYSFLEERKTGIIYTQYAAANGRGKLFLRRCGILLLSSIVITAVCFLEISIISLKLYGGIEGILDSVCSDEVFAMGSMGLSRAMWLLVNSICVALSIFAVSLLIWGIISSFHNSNIGLCFTVILCAIGVLIGRIVTAKSLFRFFKYFNIEYLIDGSKSWFTYNNWGYDKFIIGVGESTFILMIFVIIVASIILIKNCVLSNPASKIGIIEKMFMKLYELMMSILSKLPMTILEFFKVTVSQRGGIIVIITVFLFVNMNVGYPIRYGLIEVAMAGFCDEHKGASGDELLTIKENLLLELKSYENDPDAGTKIAVANKKLDLINYLIEKTEEGVDVSLINNYEYETLLGRKQFDNQQFIALLGVVIILIINAGAISYEKKTGVLSQILSGKNRDKWIRNKIIHNGLFAIFITALLYTSYYYQLIKLYNLENFDASVQSLIIFEKYPFDVPIWAFIIIDFMLKAILLMAVGGIAFLVSTMSNYDVGYLATLIIIIPYFLYDLGIEFFAYISIPRYIAFMPYWMEEKYNYNLIADTLIVLVGIVSYIYAGYRLTKKRR